MPTYWRIRINQLLVTACFVACSLMAFAQSPTDNSPYSRYGLGNLVSTNFGAADGMGGISTAFASNSQLNISNPASLGFLRTTAFEIGLYSDLSWLSTDTESSFTADGNLTHMALGFPLVNPLNRITALKKSNFNWGAAIGLLPYSRVNYEIQTENVIPGVDTVLFDYSGRGGLYQLFLSNGVSYKNTSVGLTAGYLFGNIEQERISIFTDIPNAFTNILTDDINHTGFIYNFGIQHNFFLDNLDNDSKTSRVAAKNRTRVVVGATFNNNMSISTSTRTLNRRYNANYGFDTIVSNIAAETKTILPREFSLGAMITKDNQWSFGVDYSAAQWSNYKSEIQSDSLANTYRLGFGMEYIPDHNAYNRYFKRVSYRFGGFYQLDPRVVNGVQLTSYALNFGMGMPISLPKRGTVGYTNLSIEAGQIGLNTGIRENYLQFKAAFTINDNTWFYKRKFD